MKNTFSLKVGQSLGSFLLEILKFSLINTRRYSLAYIPMHHSPSPRFKTVTVVSRK